MSASDAAAAIRIVAHLDMDAFYAAVEERRLLQYEAHAATQGLLRELAHESGRAMLLSTHDLDLALRASDRIWLLPKNGALSVSSSQPSRLMHESSRAASRTRCSSSW